MKRLLNQIGFSISQHKLIIGMIGIGISLRLVFAFLFTHNFDYLNIIVMIKSVADTNNLIEGFFVIKKAMNYEVQLYGKIYYQIAAIWLHILEFFRIIDIQYIFDTKPYQQSNGYMDAFLQWGPLHYQLFAIKLIQFLYDFIFLFFLVKIGQLLDKTQKYRAGLITFWALNPLLIYTSYALFQSDLAMVAFLTAGVYFALVVMNKGGLNMKHISIPLILMLAMYAIGAVIKQVPLLFVIPSLLILTRKLWDFIKYISIFIILYIFFSQPWASDMSIIKEFHLTSEESMALFNFSLNSVPIFLLAYCFFVTLIFSFRKKIANSPLAFILIGTLLLSLVYVSEDLNYLFVQFNIWILPFLALLTAVDKKYAFFFIAPLVGFYKRAIVDNDVLIGSLGVSLGLPLHFVPKYNDLIDQYINPELIHFMFSTVFIFVLILLIYFIRSQLTQNKTFLDQLLEKYSVFSLQSVSILILIIYSLITMMDFSTRSQFTFLTQYIPANEIKTELTNSSYRFRVVNPTQKSISGIAVPISRQEINTNGYTYFHFRDGSTKLLLATVKVNDYLFATDDTPTNIFLPKKINNKLIDIEIDKEKDTSNKLVLFTTDGIRKAANYGHFSGYDNYYNTSPLDLEFSTVSSAINILGQYQISDALHNLTKITNQKPMFYYLLYSGTTILFGFSIFLIAHHYLHQKRKT